MGNDCHRGAGQDLSFGTVESISGFANSDRVFACALSPSDPLPKIDGVSGLARAPKGFSEITTVGRRVGFERIDVPGESIASVVFLVDLLESVDLLLSFILGLFLVVVLGNAIDKGEIPLFPPGIFGSFGRFEEFRGQTFGRLAAWLCSFDLDEQTPSQFFHALEDRFGLLLISGFKGSDSSKHLDFVGPRGPFLSLQIDAIDQLGGLGPESIGPDRLQ